MNFMKYHKNDAKKKENGYKSFKQKYISREIF